MTVCYSVCERGEGGHARKSLLNDRPTVRPLPLVNKRYLFFLFPFLFFDGRGTERQGGKSREAEASRVTIQTEIQIVSKYFHRVPSSLLYVTRNDFDHTRVVLKPELFPSRVYQQTRFRFDHYDSSKEPRINKLISNIISVYREKCFFFFFFLSYS